MANNLKLYQAIETVNISLIDTLIAIDAIDYDGPNGTWIKGRDKTLKT